MPPLGAPASLGRQFFAGVGESLIADHREAAPAADLLLALLAQEQQFDSDLVVLGKHATGVSEELLRPRHQTRAGDFAGRSAGGRLACKKMIESPLGVSASVSCGLAAAWVTR